MAPEMVLANGFGTRVSVDCGVRGRRQRSKEGSDDISIFLFFSLVVASESAHQ
jgi:hypothetical protein